MGHQRQGVAIKGSRLTLFLMLLCLQGMVQVKAKDVSSIRQEERTTEAGSKMREETSQQIRRDLGHHVGKKTRTQVGGQCR